MNLFSLSVLSLYKYRFIIRAETSKILLGNKPRVCPCLILLCYVSHTFLEYNFILVIDSILSFRIEFTIIRSSQLDKKITANKMLIILNKIFFFSNKKASSSPTPTYLLLKPMLKLSCFAYAHFFKDSSYSKRQGFFK